MNKSIWFTLIIYVLVLVDLFLVMVDYNFSNSTGLSGLFFVYLGIILLLVVFFSWIVFSIRLIIQNEMGSRFVGVISLVIPSLFFALSFAMIWLDNLSDSVIIGFNIILNTVLFLVAIVKSYRAKIMGAIPTFSLMVLLIVFLIVVSYFIRNQLVYIA